MALVSTKPNTRVGDPTLSSSSVTSEEEFLKVLEEMNELCEEGKVTKRLDERSNGCGRLNQKRLTASEVKSSQKECKDILIRDEGNLSTSPLEPLFGHDDDNEVQAGGVMEQKSVDNPDDNSCSDAFFDSLMECQESVTLRTPPHSSSALAEDTPHVSSSSSAQVNSSARFGRSRHCSNNSSQSNVSFDSAIGDIFSVQTPPRSISRSHEHHESIVATSSIETQRKVNESSVSPLIQSHGIAAQPAWPPPQESPKSREGTKQAISSFSPAFSPHPNPLPKFSPIHHQSAETRKRSSAPYHLPPVRLAHPASVIAQKQDVETICMDLVRRYEFSSTVHPKGISREWISRSNTDDPLLITTKLMSDALTRLKIFLTNLDPVMWLMPHDKNILYCSQVCSVAILKAAVCVNVNALPAAYPLPYGEYLGEVEALHLILAHDLYNELKTLVSQIQKIDILREFPVALLVMMLAFFHPTPKLFQPDKVAKIHDYYAQKLQIFLNVRHGVVKAGVMMSSVLTAIEKVQNFSARLREFMNDVTRSGLQNQYEAVCENIGLIAFLLQSEPSQHPK